MRNFFLLFVGGLVLVSVVTFLYNQHFFSFIEFPPTDVSFSPPLKTQLSNPYGYLKLAQQWPPAHCNNVKRCNGSPPTDKFTIHGLWPQDVINGSSQKGNETKDIKDSALVGKLNKEWPDLENGENQRFWKHEWNDHGIFYAKDRIAYFKLTLELKSKFNVLKQLKEDKIAPSNNAPYLVQKIRESVKKLTKKNPDLNSPTA